MNVPKHLVEPLQPFADDFAFRQREGVANLSLSSIAIVGLARNCGEHLPNNLRSAAILGSYSSEWCLHI